MIWVVGIALVVVVVLVAGFFWYSMQQPLYTPGMVAAEENLSAPLAPPEQSGGADYWQVEPGVRLYHFAVGEGSNVLVVHGGPGMPYREAWTGLEPLTEEYRFHYYDQRGSGRSTRPIERFDSKNYYENMKTLDRALGLGAQIADIERIRRILGEEQLILVGHSFGGFIAALYAAEFPEHVEALVLVTPADVLVMSQDSGGGLFDTVRERLPEEMRAEYDAFLEEYMNYRDIFSKTDADLVAQNAEFGRFYGAVSDLGATPEQGEPGGWMVHGLYMSMGLRHDYREALTAVTAPVLVIHGAEDLQPESVSHLYADAFSNARVHVVSGAGHFPFYQQPKKFAGAAEDFLDASILD